MLIRHHDGRVEFRFFRPGARRVQLVGDFNGWNPAATPMWRDDVDGDWVRHLRLKRGVYRFKYLADGEWFPDYAAFGLEWGPFGVNSVAVIEQPGSPDAPSDPGTVVGCGRWAPAGGDEHGHGDRDRSCSTK